VRAYVRALAPLLPVPAARELGADAAGGELRRQRFFLKRCRNKRFGFLSFECECKGEFCLYGRSFFHTLTFYPALWVHVLFLSIQVRVIMVRHLSADT
jgi:hypothetical protein